MQDPTQITKFHHLPGDVLFLIFNLLEADQLVFLRRTCLGLLKLIDTYAQNQKPKIKFIKGIRLENLASDVKIFYKKSHESYPKIKFTENETLEELLWKIKKICKLEKQRIFLVNRTLLNFFEPYVALFKGYKSKIIYIISKLEKEHKKNYLDDRFMESDPLIFKFVESICMQRKIEIVLKDDYRIEYFFNMALINPYAKEMLIEFYKYHANHAKAFIPEIVNAIYAKNIIWSHLKSLFIVKRKCDYKVDQTAYGQFYQSVYNSHRFYLTPKLDYELPDLKKYNSFGCLHFKQLYELRFLKEILEDRYTPLLAKIKTDIISDPRFDHEDESLKKALDEIDHIALMSDTYPKNDRFIDTKVYEIDGTDKDAITEKLSRYWS